jgi:hypothetical protein
MALTISSEPLVERKKMNANESAINRLYEDIIKYGLASDSTITGYSEQEVAAVEECIGFELPNAFRYFLKSMGHGAGRFLRDYNMYQQEPLGYLGLRERAQSIIDNCDSPFELPANAFVFSVYLATSFLFVTIEPEVEDPKVWQFVDNWVVANVISPSFTSYLALSLQRILDDDRRLSNFTRDL